MESRDLWLGWDIEDRKKRIHLVVNNSRFLIFPWVNVKNLASKSLSLFFFRLDSRRKANRTLTQPQFLENIRAIVPELETMPHVDTLNRFLTRIDVEMIQHALASLVRDLIRRKAFTRFLHNKCYQIAVDGTRKCSRDYPWAEQALRRKENEQEDKEYYVYVLEANIVLNKIVLKDDSLPTVWQETTALLQLQPENTLAHTWYDRQQTFQWVNDIEYWFNRGRE